MNLYIGADLGTSGLKLLLVDSDGKVLNSVTKNYDVYYPNAGWSEQNPEDWWQAVVETVREATLMPDTSRVFSQLNLMVNPRFSKYR